MNSQAPIRLLQPHVLASLGNLELLAKTVVDGVLTGLHRSPHFGFSQEFAEYRAYNEGDDLRYVDWNVYARTDRTYIKRFRGDTNTSLTVLLDASASMAFGRDIGVNGASVSTQTSSDRVDKVSKFDYARFLAAALLYTASRQHDAIGAVVFDDKVREVIPPSSRPDTLPRLFSTLESLVAQSGTDVEGAIKSLHPVSTKRGLVAVISDFYTEPESFIQALLPLAHRQQDIVLFQIVDSAELSPEFDRVVALKDMESNEQLDVDPNWLKTEYRQKFEAHCAALKSAALGIGADYLQLPSHEPLDRALQRYLLFRQRRL